MRVAIVGTYIFVSNATEARLRSLGCEVRQALVAPTGDHLVAESAGVDVLVTWGRIDTATAHRLQAARLSLLVLMSTGAEESIDAESLDILSSGGVLVCHTPGYSTIAVAELALTLALSTIRKLLPGSPVASVPELQGREVSGSTCGVFGLGAIGTAVVNRMAALGTHMLATTRDPGRGRAVAVPVEFVDLKGLFERSDIVFITATHNESTRGVIDGQYVEALPEHGIVVNVARPEILAPVSVLAALDHRPDVRLAIDGDVDLRDRAPWKAVAAMPNVVWTPHIGFNTGRSLLRCTEVVADVISAFMAGSPIHEVAP